MYHKINLICVFVCVCVSLGTFGHVAPVDGILQEQPQSLRNFINIVIIYIPSVLAFGAFAYKLRFPLHTQVHNDKIAEGIANHLIGKPARDPCSGVKYLPQHFHQHELLTVDLMDAFLGVEFIKKWIESPKKAADETVAFAKKQLYLAILWLVTFLIITCSTFNLLLSTDPADEDLQVIPVLSIVGFGVGITMVAGAVLRLQGANALKAHIPEKETMLKLLAKRETLQSLREFPVSVQSGLTIGIPPPVTTYNNNPPKKNTLKPCTSTKNNPKFSS